jgi:hypothetical protein
VIRLGLRLTFNSGREAAVRLILIAAAVTLGAGLLLISLAGINAVNAQNLRFAWVNSGIVAQASPGTATSQTGTPGTGTAAKDPLLWVLSSDYFDSQVLGRVDVAATGSSSPVLPGITRLPGPGQYYASPALSALLRSTPADQLKDRFPGHQVGIIGQAALPSPDTLLIIIGHAPAQLVRVPGVTRVTSIFTQPPSSCNGSICLIGVGIDADGIDLILAVVACALLFPLLIFISTATRLSAARREERFASMRLVGATPRQVSVISTVESTIAAAIGAALSFGLFFAVRVPLARVPFTGQSFHTSDLSLNLPDILAVAIGVPLAAASAARIGMRRVHISPLGVTRRTVSRPPRAWRVLPLVAGLAELGYFTAAGRPPTTAGQIQVFVVGFLLVMLGLVLAGPWLTMAGSRLLARRSNRPATLIAARRLADNPRAAFRAVSGLILALFVTTVAVAVITSWVAHRGEPPGDQKASSTVVDVFNQNSNSTRSSPVGAVPDTVLAQLRAIRGTAGVLVEHDNPLGLTLPAAMFGKPASFGSLPGGLVSCAQLAGIPGLGHCPAGALAAVVPAGPINDFKTSALTWPAAPLSLTRLQRLGTQVITVATDGSTAVIEHVRTALESAYPYLGQPTTIGEYRTQGARQTLQYQQLAEVMILTSLPIAGCTLAVSVAAGLSDRKRPFSLLRLAGAPLGMLRRVVGLESALPLLVVAVLSIGVGFLASELFLKAQLGYALRPPGAEYYIIVVAGLAASLGVIASMLPLLNRITGPETARNE